MIATIAIEDRIAEDEAFEIIRWKPENERGVIKINGDRALIRRGVLVPPTPKGLNLGGSFVDHVVIKRDKGGLIVVSAQLISTDGMELISECSNPAVSLEKLTQFSVGDKVTIRFKKNAMPDQLQDFLGMCLAAEALFEVNP